MFFFFVFFFILVFNLMFLFLDKCEKEKKLKFNEFLGKCSDFVFLFGYWSSLYLILLGLFGVFLWILMVMLVDSKYGVVFCMFFGFFFVVFLDVVSVFCFVFICFYFVKVFKILMLFVLIFVSCSSFSWYFFILVYFIVW